MPKRMNKRYALIFAAVLLFVLLTAGVTLAFYYTNTDSVKNEFVPTKAACEIIENFDGVTKTDVAVKNTGDVQSYIRAKVLVNWMSDDQSKVTAKVPQKDVDYTIQYSENTHWKLASDGFWYYIVPVNIGENTENLVDFCSINDEADVPDGYYLSVEVVATAIQSVPTKAVLEGWKSGVTGVDGTTLRIK